MDNHKLIGGLIVTGGVLLAVIFISAARSPLSVSLTESEAAKNDTVACTEITCKKDKCIFGDYWEKGPLRQDPITRGEKLYIKHYSHGYDWVMKSHGVWGFRETGIRTCQKNCPFAYVMNTPPFINAFAYLVCNDTSIEPTPTPKVTPTPTPQESTPTPRPTLIPKYGGDWGTRSRPLPDQGYYDWLVNSGADFDAFIADRRANADARGTKVDVGICFYNADGTVDCREAF